MSWSDRLRILALSQLRAIKERLDRIDAETADGRLAEMQARADAERELAEALSGGGPPLTQTSSTKTQTPPVDAVGQAPPAAQSALSRHYRVLGLQDGASLTEVERAYNELVERCGALSGTEDPEEKQIVEHIRSRVDAAYQALREALNPMSGRFDKLEL